MKYIYIVLIKAHTGLGSIARRITGYEYTHTAVCLNDRFDDFISYSRRRHYLPFDAGFTHEKRDFYAFGKHKSFKAKIFRIPVDEVHEEKVMDFVSECENDDRQLFNLFSMMTMPVIHGFRIYKTHNCMSFVMRIAELSGAALPERGYWRYSIKEIDEKLSEYFYSEREIGRTYSDEYTEYMKKPTFTEYTVCSIKLISELLKRMIIKGSG